MEMDPLFGFVDEASEHQEQQQGPSGDCTISFAGPTTSATGIPQQGYHQAQSQLPGTSSSSQQPVVRVVTGKSEDNQQIYVIKLENLFQQSELGGSNLGDGVDGTFANVGGAQEPSTGQDRHNGDDGEEGRNSEDEGGDGPDPFLVVSPESALAMAQSVGVNLSEDDASELGCCTTNKLRQVVLAAMRFSQNEKTAGITSEQFAKAEELLLGSSSLGHQSVFRETSLKYAGGVSVVDDGPEIDLYATVCKNIKQPRVIPIDQDDPILHVHRLRSYDSNAQKNNNSSNFDIYDEPVVSLIPERTDNEPNNSDGSGQSQVQEGVSEAGENTVGSENSCNDKSTTEPIRSEVNVSDGIHSTEIALPEDMEADEIVDALLNDETSSSMDREGSQSTEDNTKDCNSEPKDCEVKTDDIAPEWTPYLDVLLKLTMSQGSYKDGFNYQLSPEFKLILDDVRRNGAHPIFHVICDTFRDYLRNPNISLASVVNIIAVVDSLVTSSCEPTLIQMTDLGSVLIEIIILPPPCEVHHLLTNTFMKVLTTCNELLTWTCTYVTEMLKGISDTPMNDFQDPFKCTMHGALCLANGLEDIKIQVAQEFGWHSSVINFSRNHSSVLDDQAYCLTKQDSYLEEEILKFYHNFLNNYIELVVPSDLSKIQETVRNMYGERFLPETGQTGPPPSKQTKYNTLQHPSTRCVYSKLTYKNREVILPCTKVLK